MQKYAALPNATQRILNIKADIINKLVDFYNEANTEIEHLRNENNDFIIRYMKLHTDTLKLVKFTELHGINPNMVFYYTEQELQTMINEGVKISPPAIDFENVKLSFENEGLQVTAVKSEIAEPEPDIHTLYAAKYSYLSQFCKKRQ